MSSARRVGFVSVWFERGQAHVTRVLRQSLSDRYETFVFAREGVVFGKGKLETAGIWNVPGLTTFPEYEIPADVLVEWIKDKGLDAVIFNEEYDWGLVAAAKSAGVKVLTYLDFYSEDWRDKIQIYDRVLCSSRRSFELVRPWSKAHFVGWGVDLQLFAPRKEGEAPFTFFHNAGWLGNNYRKMTPAVIAAFCALSPHMPDISLLVHAQIGVEKLPTVVQEMIQSEPRIQYHVETIAAPGLYHQGKIHVFPSKLEGLGLPVVEGLSCGLPTITTQAAPMNEFVTHGENGLLVPVALRRARPDNVAFPEEVINVAELAFAMAALANAPTDCQAMAQAARLRAERELSIPALGERIASVLDECLREVS